MRDEISLPLHDNPELAYKEFFAHEMIVKYVDSLGFQTRRSTWNLETSFDALYGDGGRQVVFCAEYDALPRSATPVDTTSSPALLSELS